MARSLSAKIIWTRAICKEPDNYIGWPTIVRKSDGELLAFFSGDREEHFCPYGKTQMVRSKDNGKTWSSPVTINNTPLDDRDVGAVVLRDGTIVISWFTGATWRHFDTYRDLKGASVVAAWERHCNKISEEERQRWLGNWTRRSTDGGNTWEPPVCSIASAPHGPVELADGRLLYVGTAQVEGQHGHVCVESIDKGRSWHKISEIPHEPDEPQGYSEPHSVQLKNGRLISLWRFNPADRRDQCFLRQSESDDGGYTWTVGHATPIWGYPPHLLLLANGDVMVSYGHRREPFSERACLSHDGGKTWDVDNIITICSAPNGDLGYPATVELSPGELLTVCYQIDKPGEKTSLVATRWSLK